ncbi:ArnT family glycosyltransferase [Ferruginibacter profundus]
MKQIKLTWIIIFLIGAGVRSTELFHAVDTESWRESDVSTIAKNFYQNHTDILHPQVAWDGSGPGYTEGEFQLYSYLIAASYKIFGFWEPAGRMISFLFSLATMLVFFRLCRYLLDSKSAIAAAVFFALSPILFVVSNTVQPESVMFFFYVAAGYSFIRWLDDQSKKYFLLAACCTALALLCKLTAANIGILFLLLLIFKKGWKFLFKPQVLLLGIIAVLPSVFWYWYSHKFYLQYGNSLGLSNEYAWVGMDFFTNKHFIQGLFKIELLHVWTKLGPVIIILALLFTPFRKKESTLIAAAWFASAFIFYIMAVRTTADDWAYYYHIFSIPAASILLGTAVIELYNKYFPALQAAKGNITNKPAFFKSAAILTVLVLSMAYFLMATSKYLVKIKPTNFQTSPFYSCKDSLAKLIPPGSLFLANGGLCGDYLGHPKAYNNSYFFYWLNRKGYNICVGDLSLKNITDYKIKGVSFFLAEEKVIQQIPGLEEALKQQCTTLFECNGCILFKL